MLYRCHIPKTIAGKLHVVSSEPSLPKAGIMRGMQHNAPLAVDMRNIRKAFPLVVANDNVSFDVRWGEVKALVGENGAGKSTLMKILYGMQSPDSGEIVIDGAPAVMHSPNDAIKLGIGMVHQHFMLVEPLTVTENIVLGLEP